MKHHRHTPEQVVRTRAVAGVMRRYSVRSNFALASPAVLSSGSHHSCSEWPGQSKGVAAVERGTTPGQPLQPPYALGRPLAHGGPGDW